MKANRRWMRWMLDNTEEGVALPYGRSARRRRAATLAAA